MSGHSTQPSEPSPEPIAGAVPTRRDARPERRRGSARRRPLRLVLGVLVLLVLAWVVAVAVSGFQAGRALQRVADAVPTLEQQVRDQDFTAAQQTATRVSDDSAAADRATRQLPYTLAEHLPWVGDQLAAVRGGSHAAMLLTAPLPDALGVADDVLGDGLVSADQTVNVAGIEALTPIVTDFQARIAAARTSLHDGESPDVLAAISDRLDPVTDQLDAIADPLDTAAQVLPQLPALLGADGARTYLVAFTNPAEIRPVQGMVGAYAYLSVDAGKISLSSTGTDADLYDARSDIAAAGEEYAALYGTDDDATLVQNVTMGGSADEAGVLTASLFTDGGLPAPDVVVFVDPVGLGQLLGVDHAPLELGPFGQVATADLAKVLMYDAYVTFGEDQDARKAFLAATSAAAFEAVLSDGLSSSALSGAGDAVDSGHLAVWSSVEQEQTALVAAGVAGVLGAPADAVAHVGLTNTEPSKLDYWVQPAFTLSAPCASVGTGTSSLELTLTNTVPEDIPDYVANATRSSELGRRTAQETVSLWMPPWVGLDQVMVDGAPVATAVDSEEGWRLVRLTVDLPPGAPVVVRWAFSGSVDALPTTVLGPSTATAPTVTEGTCTP